MNLWNNIFTWDIRDYEQYLWDKMEDFSTLLEGPTGSGKGAAAAAIGRSGYIPFDPVKQQFKTSFTTTFIPINLSQFPETLLESELFGHTKGAFTGTVSGHQGVLSLCGQYGTIFLDEIGETALPVQVKLLKVLEERMFSPVGSHEFRRFDGRVIARPTNRLNNSEKKGDSGTIFITVFARIVSGCLIWPSESEKILQELTELVETFHATDHRQN